MSLPLGITIRFGLDFSSMQDRNRLRDELMQQVYGPHFDEAKSDAEVLSLIKNLEQGMARDQALNADLSPEQMAALLAREEYERAALETALTFPYLDDAAKAEAVRKYGVFGIQPEQFEDAAGDDAASADALEDVDDEAVSADAAEDEISEDEADEVEAGEAIAPEAAPPEQGTSGSVHYHSPFSYEFWELKNVQATMNLRSIYKSRGVSRRLAKTTPAAKYRGSRYAMAPEVLADIKELNSRGLSLEDIATQVQAHFKIQCSVNRLSTLLRYGLRELNDFNQRTLNPCFPLIYVDVVPLRMLTSANLLVEHPFFFMMGLDFKGDKELLKVFTLPKDYQEPGVQAQMWQRALSDLKARGMVDPIYFVTGAVTEFGEALREVYPQAIYQRSTNTILSEAISLIGPGVPASELNDFSNNFRNLASCKTLLECMKLFAIYERRWQGRLPGAAAAIEFLRRNFVFFEQYYAAEPAIRASMRTTKPLDNIINNVRRAIRNDHSYLFCDALHTLCRVLEIERYYTVTRRPVQWRRALKAMLDDPYTSKIIGKYLSPDDVRLSERSVKRDLANLRSGAHKVDSAVLQSALAEQERLEQERLEQAAAAESAVPDAPASAAPDAPESAERVERAAADAPEGNAPAEPHSEE